MLAVKKERVAQSSPLEAMLSFKQDILSVDWGDPVACQRLVRDMAALMVSVPDYDVVGMNPLVDRLRHDLRNIHDRDDGLDSINKLHQRINVSRAYISQFRDGQMVCMNIMNRMAKEFGVRYIVENYQDTNGASIE